MSDPDFLTAFHETFRTPRPVVIDFVERSTGRRVAELRRLALGDENEVYQAGLTEETTVYARIRPPGAGTFAAEVWAMDTARAAGIAVPTVIGVDQLESGSGPPRSAMLLPAATGRQLSGLLPGLTARQRHRVMINVGRTVARLHAITTPGVQQPGPDGRWPDPTRARAASIAERTEQCRRLPDAGFSAVEVELITELMTASPDTPAVEDPVLCHGDLHSGHVFLDEELRVSAIIDWGLWHGGSPVGELAALSGQYAPADFEDVLDGYGLVPDDHPDLRRRLALSMIIQAVGHLAWHLSIGNVDGQHHYADVMRQSLAELSLA